MDRERLDDSLKEIRHLLSHLQGEVMSLESSYFQVLRVLRKFEGIAGIDELTGLMRRGVFFEKWHALVDECRKLNKNCGLLMVDVDFFKRINDAHGHPTGDEVIKRIALLLKQYESPNCFSGRYGGEEFAVAVRGTDAEILGLAEFLRRGAERLHGPVMGSDGKASSRVEWKCTVSVGLASARKVGFDASRLLVAADQALYEAKKKGRNRVSA